VSPPTDSPAPSGLLDPPPDGLDRPPPPSAQWAVSIDDFWLDDESLNKPGAAGPAGPGGHKQGAPTEAKPSRHGSHSARMLRRNRFSYPVRRWPRRILITSNLVVLLMLLSAASVYGYVNWRVGQIKHVVIPHLVGGHALGGPAVGPAAAAPAPPGAPMTILVVGSDSRAGNTGASAKQFGNAAEVGGARSDTIMLVRVIPSTTQAQILSIPRDLWVKIPGTGGDNRINSAFNNGPDLLVQTIEDDLGIPIDHYVDVDFQSFKDIVNAVGGVEEYFPTPVRDSYSLLNIPNPGCYNMTGNMALSFVRSRHYEYKVNGEWVYEAESDLARIQRQQSFVKKMIAKAQGSGLTNPLELNQIIGGVTTNLTLDSGFSESLLLTLAKRFKDISPGTLPTATLPTTAAVIGGADVLLLDQTQAKVAINQFLNPPPPPPASTATSTPTPTSTTTTSTTVPGPSVLPSSVTVAVLNGSGRTGEAGTTATALEHEGFRVTHTASATNYNYASPEILYQPGDEAQAQLLSDAVIGGAQLQADPTLQGVQVELITGQSYQGITALPATGVTPPTPTTPPSTVPSTTTTTIYQLPGTPPGFTTPTC